MGKNWKGLNSWQSATHYRKADRWVGITCAVLGVIGWLLPWGGA